MRIPEHVDAMCGETAAANASACMANVEADREVQRVRAELPAPSRGGGGTAGWWASPEAPRRSR